MYDRDTAMLEKYDLTVKNIRKVRGGWFCIAQEGLFLWKESSSKEERINLEDKICRKTEEMGLSHIWNCAGGSDNLRMDRFVRNQEGMLLTEDGYGRKFVLKQWTEGRECEVRNTEDLFNGARAAACLHQILRAVKPELEKVKKLENPNPLPKPEPPEEKQGMEMKSAPDRSVLAVREPYEELWNRRKKEISRVQGFVRRRRNKNTFEQMIMKETPYYAAQAQEALELLAGIGKTEELQICHGDFHYHNLIYGRQENWICQTSRFHLGNQISDFYLFLRKCMEKQGWNRQLAGDLLNQYRRCCPVSRENMQLLYCLFLFPEKYWKQLNFYVQSNKAWMPEKNVVKLKSLVGQEQKRKEFLESLYRMAFDS